MRIDSRGVHFPSMQERSNRHYGCCYSPVEVPANEWEPPVESKECPGVVAGFSLPCLPRALLIAYGVPQPDGAVGVPAGDNRCRVGIEVLRPTGPRRVPSPGSTTGRRVRVTETIREGGTR